MLELQSPPKAAVIGAGNWGRNLVRDFYSLGALKLVCDQDPKILEEAREAYPEIAVASSLAEVLSDPEIKAVALATPAVTHGELGLKILSSGRDLLVEKPLAMSASEGRALVAMASEKGLILMVDHLLNRHPAVERLKSMVAAGELGRIVHLSSARRNFGVIRRDENALWSLAPHDVAMVLGLMGSLPQKVLAVGGGGYLTRGVEDAAYAHLFFDNDATAAISVSWLHPYKEHRLSVVGLEKMAVFDDTLPWDSKLTVYPHKIRWRGSIPKAERAQGERVPLAETEPLKLQCQVFLEAVRTRIPPADSHGEEALRVLRVLESLGQSLRDGQIRLIGGQAGTGYQAHPTAVVDPGAVIGQGTKIWHFSHVLEGSVIGDDVNIGQNVVVGPRAKIGRGCKIQNNVSVYEGVELEEDVFCGPSMVFTNVFNPRAFIRRMGEMRRTVVRRGATIGANATIVCGYELGRYSFIAAGAVVAQNVKNHALMMGVPARRTGWVCRCGQKLESDLSCPACSLKYKEDESGLEKA
ncbi:MAG: Gfo/Idh/MocA family oxidoreductase [Deltaproteobacteria bacterium]|jgi:UDP-2-acetamido-3-amino-2,3-dideoxy-glucuronate N-acetyltransferase|nr:Gfo/Idh/MocA family oxidoreductase [Deltaproteobacteria bacterium]